jgi:hypothetical protein
VHSSDAWKKSYSRNLVESTSITKIIGTQGQEGLETFNTLQSITGRFNNTIVLVWAFQMESIFEILWNWACENESNSAELTRSESEWRRILTVPKWNGKFKLLQRISTDHSFGQVLWLQWCDGCSDHGYLLSQIWVRRVWFQSEIECYRWLLVGLSLISLERLN